LRSDRGISDQGKSGQKGKRGEDKASSNKGQADFLQSGVRSTNNVQAGWKGKELKEIPLNTALNGQKRSAGRNKLILAD